MPVREYKARSIQEAISRIRQDIGPNAMIISTRRIPKNKRDPYGHDVFEVMALDPLSTSGPDKAERKSNSPVQDKAPSVAPEVEKTLTPSVGNELVAIRDELISIKDMMLFLDQTRSLPGFLSVHPECLNLYARLVKAGISEKRSQVLVKKGYAQSKDKPAPANSLTVNVFKEIFSSIMVSNPFKSKKGQKVIAAFIGPTGVGKTTTIAKLAADLSLKQKKKVGLISVDGYRIGAVDQLKTYAAIMGIPCLPAFTSEDVRIAVNQLRNRDVVLIDTAGQNHLDKKRIRELGHLIQQDLPITTHLVLSVTSKIQDMIEAAKNFSVLNPKSYIFSKIDETRECGGIIDQILECKLPVSFLTNGQKVPDDILPATKKNITELVLRKGYSANRCLSQHE